MFQPYRPSIYIYTQKFSLQTSQRAVVAGKHTFNVNITHDNILYYIVSSDDRSEFRLSKAPPQIRIPKVSKTCPFSRAPAGHIGKSDSQLAVRFIFQWSPSSNHCFLLSTCFYFFFAVTSSAFIFPCSISTTHQDSSRFIKEH